MLSPVYFLKNILMLLWEKLNVETKNFIYVN